MDIDECEQTLRLPELKSCSQSSSNSSSSKVASNSLKIQPKDFILKNQKHLLEVYSLDKNDTLGEGGHASIFKINEIGQEGKDFPIKKCVKKFDKRNLFFKNNEIQSLKSLDHPNIVKIYEYFEERDAFYIVMEEVKGRDLYEEITQRGKPLAEKEACQIVKQILLALVYTHQKGLIHRDIKLDNIMVNITTNTTQSTNSNATSRQLSQVKSDSASSSENIVKSDSNNSKLGENHPQLDDNKSKTDDNKFQCLEIYQNKFDDKLKDNCKEQTIDKIESTNLKEQSNANNSQDISSNQTEKEQIWSVKLIDWSFGLDTNVKKNKFYNTMCGSLPYQAPEYFDKKYNEKIDIWALGVVLYTVLSNKYPFTGKNKMDTQLSIQKNNIVFGSEWKHISDEGKDLIIKMLEKNPENRPSAQELLSHVWFKIQKSSEGIHQETEVIKNNLRHLKQFKCDNEFQKAILTFISVNLVSSNDKVQLERLFKMLDTNEDGRLSKDEILNGFNETWGENYIDEQQIQEIFLQVDSDQSNSIDYSEFITATLDRATFNEKTYLQKAFNLFDTDGDGQITKSEILRILGNSQDSTLSQETDDYIQSMINQVDTSKDGKISFDEFCIMIESFSNTEIQMSQ